MKIVTVLGARPQFIKAAPLSRALSTSAEVSEVIVHTGQHFDPAMSDVFFTQLDIPRPQYELGISSLTHGAMTGRMVEALERVFVEERPDCVLVYGDTNSTLAGALAATKLLLPVVHVEAGLRSRNPRMPEEVNRVLTDRIAAALFCPTTEAATNLASEGFPGPAIGLKGDVVRQRIAVVGDVMYDAVLHYRSLAMERVDLSALGLEAGAYVLCTLHRQENTDDPRRLRGILSALQQIARELQVVLPIHPRTRHRLAGTGLDDLLRGITVIDPLPYLEIQRLQMGAVVILTDSGGLQKEALFHQVPCVTLRDETEWVETVTSGWNVLVGADEQRILTAFRERQPGDLAALGAFGDGDAATRIAQDLVAWGLT